MTITLPRLHPAQARIEREARRFNVADCGRRFGKDVMAVKKLIEPALRGYPVAWFAPTHKMLRETWRDVSFRLAPIATKMNEQELRIELLTRGVVDMWSLESDDTARGRKYKRVIINEAAMVAHLEDAWQKVIRPTLADYEGDAWFLSTPRGMNFFRTLYQWGQDAARPDWASWQMPTTANPFIKASEVEAARRELPERTFRQEFLAEFIEDGNGIFRRVTDAATVQPQDAPMAGHQYIIGVDWAKLEDFTVFTVMDTTTREVVYMDRFNQIDYQTQIGRLWALYAASSLSQ